jgi:hypothetical protein
LSVHVRTSVYNLTGGWYGYPISIRAGKYLGGKNDYNAISTQTN